MIKIFDFKKDRFNLPTIIMIVAIIIGIIHLFSYLLPFTDDAFVVANVEPVAADVSGYITDIYVKNGQKVNKNDPLFKVFDTPYQLAYKKAVANYNEVLANIAVVKEETKKNQAVLDSSIASLAKVKYNYGLKSNKLVSRSVSKLEVTDLNYDVQALTKQVKSLQDQLVIDDKQIQQLQAKAQALKADVANAKVNLDLTTVRAGSNGVVDNMYLAVGTPIIQHQPLFSFINTDTWYIQANFNETDLRNVRPGDKVIIVLRMYYFDKIFHGVITNTLWASDRQQTAQRTQQQTVTNENEWLRLPQRFPLQIKVLDPDPNYPLNPGASAYVYVKT
jgi:multidrug resistance efflux pump